MVNVTRSIRAAMVWMFASAWAACGGPVDLPYREAPFDAGFDAQPVDAGTDIPSYYTVLDIDADTAPDFDAAAFDPFVGVWNPLPSRPNECSERYAADPSVSVPPLMWAACPSGRNGCRRLVVDWTSSPTKSLSFPLTEPMRVVNGHTYLEYVKIWPKGLPSVGDFYAYMYAITEVDGPPAFAIADVIERPGWTDCGAEIGFGDFGIGIEAYNGDYNAEMFGWAPWSDPLNITSVLLSMPPGVMAIDMSLSESHMFTMLQPPGVNFFDLASGAIAYRDTPTAFEGAQTFPTEDGAFSTGISTANFLHVDGSWNVVVEPQPTSYVSWISLDRSQSNALVWLEIDYDDYDGLAPVLWTSPYATSASGVAARKVAVISGSAPSETIITNAGVSLIVTGPSSALLTRLSDGMGWSITPEVQDAFAWPLWVDDTEVWIATGDAGNPAATAMLSGITRITRASLGAPTVSRGF